MGMCLYFAYFFKYFRETEKLFRELMFEIELETEKPISTFVFSKQEWHDKHLHTPLYDNIKKEGIQL